jgi:hypothetical protein
MIILYRRATIKLIPELFAYVISAIGQCRELLNTSGFLSLLA